MFDLRLENDAVVIVTVKDNVTEEKGNAVISIPVSAIQEKIAYYNKQADLIKQMENHSALLQKVLNGLGYTPPVE